MAESVLTTAGSALTMVVFSSIIAGYASNTVLCISLMAELAGEADPVSMKQLRLPR